MCLLFSYSAFRTLRWELVSKRDGSRDFHYVMAAYRHMAPDQLPVNPSWNGFPI